ncbi:MAG: hypothetical protein Q7K39_01330, partial [Candidatus Magasanikbacteria bacterium]|nr:hypothetical protein [Candidatus Magasanikbacteria bacterium]
VSLGLFMPELFLEPLSNTNNAELVSGSSRESQRGILGAVAGWLRELGLVIVDGVVSVREFVVDVLTAKKINSEEVNTKKLCLSDICVSEQELRGLLKNLQINYESNQSDPLITVTPDNITSSAAPEDTNTSTSTPVEAAVLNSVALDLEPSVSVSSSNPDITNTSVPLLTAEIEPVLTPEPEAAPASPIVEPEVIPSSSE